MKQNVIHFGAHTFALQRPLSDRTLAAGLFDVVLVN